MRLIEEKQLIIIEIITLIFIGGSTCVVEFAEKKVDDWDNRIIHLENNANNLMLISSAYENRLNFFLLEQNLLPFYSGELHTASFSPEVEELQKKYKNQEIPKNEFINGVGNLLHKDAYDTIDMYKKRIKEVNLIRNDPPHLDISILNFKIFIGWDWFSKIIKIIRIVAICISAFFYYFLYKSISLRSNKK